MAILSGFQNAKTFLLKHILKIGQKKFLLFAKLRIHDEKYIKSKVREFSGVIKTNFLGGKVPKENEHYTCIACITIDSVMRMEKKNYPQVYLEECKYKTKKTKMTKFIEAEVEHEPESECELESDLN